MLAAVISEGLTRVGACRLTHVAMAGSFIPAVSLSMGDLAAGSP